MIWGGLVFLWLYWFNIVQLNFILLWYSSKWFTIDFKNELQNVRWHMITYSHQREWHVINFELIIAICHVVFEWAYVPFYHRHIPEPRRCLFFCNNGMGQWGMRQKGHSTRSWRLHCLHLCYIRVLQQLVANPVLDIFCLNLQQCVRFEWIYKYKVPSSNFEATS